MKKILVLTVLVVLLGVFSQGLQAGSIWGNFGVITDQKLSFEPLLWYIGANLDFNIGNILFLSPEANVVSYKFKFKDFFFEPALLLNVKLSGFFVGAGVDRFWVVSGGDEYEIDMWGLKLNAGYSGKNIRFRVFAISDFDNLFKDMLVGAQIGIGF